MVRRIYALLIGIDKYPSPVPPLKGCVNDITVVEEYLHERISHEEFLLNLLTLKNKEATRQSIIDGFRQHLCSAQSNDVALFYFSGHGSQEDAPPEFWYLEPDRLNETLVCWDSRNKGIWDLADKEIAKLIAEVAQKNPHIVIVLDCCHSGSGSRGDLQKTLVRCAPRDKRQRPLSSFIVSPEEVSFFSNSRRTNDKLTGWFILPEGQHILLAACRDSEEAKEYYVNGQVRGAFSFFLMDTLQRTNGNLTYQDLFKRTDALVHSKVKAQSPQLETTNPQTLDQFFLGGALAERYSYFTVSYHIEHEWIIDGGAVHGIPAVYGSEGTRFALFPFDIKQEQLFQLSQSKGEAEITEVFPHLSKVEITGIQNLSFDTIFKAVTLTTARPPKGVYLEGEEDGIKLMRQALMEGGPFQASFLSIHEVQKLEKAEFCIFARDGQYIITRPADDRPLVSKTRGYTWQNALQVLKRLEHIVRWTDVVELGNPANSQIRANAIEMQIVDLDGKEIKTPSICLEYRYEDNHWKQPAFRIKLTNNSQKKLYCALLDLTETYGIFANLFAAGGVWLNPGEEAWAYGGKPIPTQVLDKFWQQGITEFKDILKLIVSTAEFDVKLMELPDLDLPNGKLRVQVKGFTEVPKSRLNYPIKSIQNRHFGLVNQEFLDDWVTSQINIKTIRPLL